MQGFMLLVLMLIAAPLAAQQIPPSAALGRRVVGYAHRAEVVPTVVIATDLPSFVEAVSRWTPRLQFPVLLDDGSHRAQEDIARFVRGFEPEDVLRFSRAGEIPEEPAERRRWVEGALERVFDAGTQPTPTLSLVARWQDLGHTPPGVVVCDDDDEAWAGGLALAAGRGQPIVWVKRTVEGRVSGAMQHTAAQRLVEQIEAGCERTGLPWQGVGDAIEAITLCLNTPAKLRADFGENARERFALTDLVGRRGALQAGRARPSERWAWSGQITGDAASSVYQAMCALFFEPSSAWLFDGYADEQPWNAYDATRAAALLDRAGFTTALTDTPRGTHDDWLLASARAVHADLAMVNSSGQQGNFALQRGRGSYRDAPMLGVPTAVYFVHSFSAAQPDNRKTVAGRWRERGAFAYVGSVHEPFLQAFVPTPAVAGRLLSGVPLAAAVRPDDAGSMWKITVMGDPLLVFTKPRGRSDAGLPLGGVDVAASAVSLINAGRFAEAMRMFVMLGRDEDAVEFAGAVLSDRPAEFDADLAETVALAAFRTADTDVLAATVSVMGPARSEVSGAADALWFHAEPLLQGGIGGGLAAALRSNLREGTVVRDAVKLARAMRSAGDAAGANAMLAEAERRVDRPADVKALRDAAR
ncbi:MAG: hypothetical protein AAF937_12635 [Planctomycetota bacterium]